MAGLTESGTLQNPQPHGEFMARAYQESYTLGQLAVSYVVEHYGVRRNGFRTADAPTVPESQEMCLAYIAAGLTPDEEAKEWETSLATVRNRRCLLMNTLQVGSVLAAVRIGIEYSLVTVVPPPEPKPADFPDLLPYDLVGFDLSTRDVKGREIKQLMGGAASTTSDARAPRIANALGLSREQKELAIVGLYNLGVFRQGLGLLPSLAEHPQIVRRFDRQLGRNRPFERYKRKSQR